MRDSTIAHPGPTTSSVFYWIGWLWFKIFGWTTYGEPPQHSHAVIIAAPHTTNWDLPHMLAAAWLFRMKISWMGKHTLFVGPFGWFLRAMGGVPVNRDSPQGLVRGIARSFKEHDRLFLAVPPSGTRGKRDGWKSGFYWIAKTADVPIVAGYLDYKTKRACLGFSFQPSRNIVEDMDKLRAFYREIEGKYPENQNDIFLKEEKKFLEKEARKRRIREEEAREAAASTTE